MDDNNPKQLIVDRVKQATNILVTVENNPSVDELAAALALTLMLNKLDKHATAVFSGAIPPAINFLEPNKTFEHTVDSLRDFIIALDKEKADRLRYKVEDDMVKIFITPYRSTITSKDLEFSEGDFNVEVVIALGVEKKESLDRAIAAHGRILHDATVITINARDEHSTLGVIDWQDGKASSICEMLVGLAEALEPKLLDTQISTALLTGIVAATDRFSNKGTTPHIMTMAAELMAAGANQQLIANSLQQAAAEKVQTQNQAEGRIDREAEKKEGTISEESQKVEKPIEKAPTDGSKGEMKVRHEEGQPEETPQPAEEKETAAAAVPTAADELGDLSEALKSVANETPPKPPTPSAPPTPPVTPPPTPPAPAISPAKAEEPKIIPLNQRIDESHSRPNWQELEPPTLGGTLNATSAEAEEARRREAEEEREHNNVTLSHGGGALSAEGGLPTEFSVPTTPPPAQTATPSLAPLPPIPGAASAPAPTQPLLPPTPPAPAPPSTPSAPQAPISTPPPDNSANQQEDDLAAARNAVSAALADEPLVAPSSAPAPTPPAPAAQPLPPMGGSTQPTPAAAPMGTPPAAPNAPGGLPPLPDFSTLPPLPSLPGSSNGNQPMQPNSLAHGTDVTAQFAAPGQAPGTPAPLPPTQQPPTPPAPGQVTADPNDPNQFRIPGQ